MTLTLEEITNQFEKVIPLTYQESWDRSGLQIGSFKNKVTSVLFSLDLCHEVIREAISKKVELIVTHHPVQMADYKNVNCDTYEGWMIEHLIKNNIAVYASHTNHDSSKRSLNRYYALKLKLKDLMPIRTLDQDPFLKLVVYVPSEYTQKVLNAMFDEGAGYVGAYSHCSFRSQGTGTFKGDESTNPFIGKPGQLEEAIENRVEVIVPRERIRAVIDAMIKAHPYEEVAYDILVLANKRWDIGSGIYGELEKPHTAKNMVSLVKKIFNLKKINFVGNPNQKIKRIGICTGSGTSLLKDVFSKKIDLFITGDVKYHYAIDALRKNVCLIDPGHFASEVFSVNLLKEIFKELFGNQIQLLEYKKLKNPFQIL